ncbi:hypothetical protein UlMin_011845 [Ulmus minor]
MTHNRLAKMLFNDDSDDEFHLLATIIEEEEMENEDRTSHHPGYIPSYAVIQRDRVQGNDRLYRDYFADTPTFGPRLFQRRFRMNHPLCFRIQHAVEAYDPYFVQRRDACGALGLSSLQKKSAAFRMLAYGVPADSVDEYMRIGESIAIESLKKFVKAIIAVFGDEYLRSPNSSDIARLLEINSDRGFPGMLGSIDCMHWKWKNCPVAWQGMYSGHIHEPTIILEAIASYDLWIWHASFGLPESPNDINVLERSTVFKDFAEGRGPHTNYSINGHEYTMRYYLVDGIYPSWSTFVKTLSSPQGNKNKYFAACQESARKDVERAFGVLQSRFAIVRGPACFWDQETLNYIMKACII